MNVSLFWSRGIVRPIRLLCIAFVGMLFALVLFDDGLSISLARHTQETVAIRISTSIWYALPILIALLFYAVGSLVWLYGQQRVIARLLFTFCSLIAIAFGTLLGADVGNGLLNALGCSCSALAVPVLMALLLRFPLDTFSRITQRVVLRWLLLVSQFLLAVFSLIPLTYGLSVYLFGLPVPSWWYALAVGYYGVSGLGIVAIVLLYTRYITSVRIRQQMQLFLTGILLSFAPILCLTVLPTLLHLRYVIDGQLSMLFLVCFPLTLGYAILRYQIVILDTYIRRFASWVVGVITLAVLSYIFIATSGLALGDQSPLFYMAVLMLWPLMAWWAVQKAQSLTERFFFSEILHYRNIITTLPMQTLHADLTEVAQALVTAAKDMFGAPAACAFVLDDQHQSYVLCSPYTGRNVREQEQTLLAVLFSILASAPSSQERRLDAQHPLIHILQGASRPLSLNELLREDEHPSVGLARYLAAEPLQHTDRDPLLVALHAQGKMIAILVLDERGNHERYAGPDFTGIDLLLSRFIPLLQTARLTQALSVNNAQLLEVNAQLQATNIRLTELDQLKDQFIITTSHELRTPITSVLLHLNLLSTFGDKFPLESRQEFLRKAQTTCNELVQKVEMIYETSRLEFDLQQLETKPVLLNTVIAEVANVLAAEAIYQQRFLQIDVPEGVIVLASARHLREVLLNLASNAFKYSPHGTPVTITVFLQEESVTVAIQDQGLGVPPEAHLLLFERFVRLERDLNSPIRGAGLGLAICKQFTEAMGGRIWLESTGISGEGSTFYFTLKRLLNQPTSDRALPHRQLYHWLVDNRTSG